MHWESNGRLTTHIGIIGSGFITADQLRGRLTEPWASAVVRGGEGGAAVGVGLPPQVFVENLGAGGRRGMKQRIMSS